MILNTLLQNYAFDPEEIKAMATAYEEALKILEIADPTDPMAEVLAMNIIEFAKRGERDPVRLRERALGGGDS